MRTDDIHRQLFVEDIDVELVVFFLADLLHHRADRLFDQRIHQLQFGAGEGRIEDGALSTPSVSFGSEEMDVVPLGETGDEGKTTGVETLTLFNEHFFEEIRIGDDVDGPSAFVQPVDWSELFRPLLPLPGQGFA